MLALGKNKMILHVRHPLVSGFGVYTHVHTEAACPAAQPGGPALF